jgi:hypothetical protein
MNRLSLHKLDDKSYNFFVVDFYDGFELVPRNWILHETGQCYWPDATTPRNYDRAVESMEQPKDTWQLHRIKKITARASKDSRLGLGIFSHEYHHSITYAQAL